METAITKQPVTGLKGFNQMITNPKTTEYLNSVLGQKKDSFINNLTALVSNAANLQECVPVTLMYAAIKATALNLPFDPNLGYCYVIPYKDNKAGVTLAQFQMGYKGFIQLAQRTGQYQTINVRDVREGEIRGEDFISGTMEFCKAEDRENKPIIGYVAYFKLLNGFEKMFYWTKAEVEMHAKRYSKTYGSQWEKTRNSSKWATDFDAMACKTVLKLLLSKYGPMSVEMAEAVKNDQKVYDGDGRESYADNDAVVVEAESASKAADMLRQAFAKGEGDDLPNNENEELNLE